MRPRTLITIIIAVLSIGSAHAQTACCGGSTAPCQQTSIRMQREALRDSILNNITGAAVPEYTIDITRCGARGDGKRDCRKAFAKAIAKATEKRGVRIIVPAGTYFIKGPITLASNVTIELMKGATLKFSPDPADYPMVKTSWEGTFIYNYSPMIYGYNLHDVAITGEGTIDGNAMETFATWKSRQSEGQALSRKMKHEETDMKQRRFGEGFWLRPQLIQMYRCERVTLQGVKITNSPFWCVHLLESENIVCRGLRYDAKLVNNDGIDPECSRNILIEDISFDNGDDNIAIKSGRDNDGWRIAKPSENIVIRRCHFKGLHAVVIGSEMSAGVRNVIVEDCDYAGYCKRGLYIKTNPDRGGFVRGIYVSQCHFGEVEDLLHITSRYAGQGLDNNHFSTIEDIYIDGLTCKSASAAALVLQGTKEKSVRNVHLDNIEVGQAKNAISFENVRDIHTGQCFIGGKAGTPTQVSAKDNIFGRDRK